MKKKIILAFLALALLLLLTACSGDSEAVLTYYVDGELYHTSTVKEEGELFGNIGKEPTKEGFLFGGWFYDEGAWEDPLDYTELNRVREEEKPDLYARAYAKWEVVSLRFEENTRSYTVIGLLDGAGSDVVIPAKYKNFPITAIDANAFRGNTKLVSVTIPDSVAVIGENAFAECTALVEVTLPNGVAQVGKNAFANCISLTRATLSAALQEISFEMFYNCPKLSEVVMHQSVRKIGARAFAGCSSLSSLTLPINITNLGSDFLWGTSVETLNFNGVMERWNKVNASALTGSSVVTVKCLDGDVTVAK